MTSENVMKPGAESVVKSSHAITDCRSVSMKREEHSGDKWVGGLVVTRMTGDMTETKNERPSEVESTRQGASPLSSAQS
jgi:hypothetical protein